jgi:phage terminase large subunit
LSKIQTKVTRVFDRNASSTAQRILNVGGARSSKSYSIAQLFVIRFLTEKNKKFLVTRKTGPALKLTAMRLILDLLKEWGAYTLCEHNLTDRTLSFGSNFLAFLSIDDPEKIKSTEWNYVWMEEANEFTWDDFMVLRTRLSAARDDTRPNQMFFSMNPVDEYAWIHQKLEGMPNTELIHSTYRDNPYLSAEYIAELADLKNQDEVYWKIYSEGEWATNRGVIYSNYELVDELPNHLDSIAFGLDFGYNNPTALVMVGWKDQEVFADEMLYESQVITSDLAKRMEGIVVGGAPVYADSAEPDRIEELRRAGYNVIPADKSVMDGILEVKRHKLHITKRSVNVIKEIHSYSWKVNKEGVAIDGVEPVKFQDHAMDAIRYVVYSCRKPAFAVVFGV